MSQEEINDTQEQRQPTEEEIKAFRKKSTEFYQEEIKFLKIQKQYEELRADVEDAKTRRLRATREAAYIFAEMEEAQKQFNAQQEAENDAEPTETKTRTLKRDV